MAWTKKANEGEEPGEANITEVEILERTNPELFNKLKSDMELLIPVMVHEWENRGGKLPTVWMSHVQDMVNAINRIWNGVAPRGEEKPQ